MSTRRATPARMVATLAVLGFISGLAIVTVFLLSEPAIEAHRRALLEAAIFHVVPGSSRREAHVVRDGKLVKASPREESGGEPRVYAAYDDAGALVGWAIPAEGPGFQDTIKLIYGYDPARGMVTGMEVLESRETPGLGDKIVKDAGFLAQFLGLAVEPEVAAVKNGADSPNEVDAISGATISSQAVVRIINEANQRWRRLLDGGGDDGL